VADPKAASWYLSRRMRVWGLFLFWAVILWKQYVQVEPHGRESGLPFCERHFPYWPRRAWFVVGGFITLALLFGLAYATDPSTDHHQKMNLFSYLAVIWFLIYPLGFILVPMGSMRVLRHDGHRVTLVGVSKKFAPALVQTHPEYAADKKPTHLQELKQLLSEYVR